MSWLCSPCSCAGPRAVLPHRLWLEAWCCRVVSRPVPSGQELRVPKESDMPHGPL